MKTIPGFHWLMAIFLMVFSIPMIAQVSPYIRPNDKSGLNIFENSKPDTVSFKKLRVHVGGDLATQFQGLDQENAGDSLVELGTDFSLPAANLNLDVELLNGVNLQLKTYLSSNHHEETWVKGGHLQIDRLDFIHPGFLGGVMDIASFQFGLDEFNYGDAHFRRSDNARVIFNPFMENYIMDAFSTEVYGEVTIQKNAFLGVLGLTNGKMDQDLAVGDSIDNKPSFYGKIGLDTKYQHDLRLRLTGSWYINKGLSNGNFLYNGDRAGSRYHNVLQTISESEGDSDFGGRFNPRFLELTAIQINPFLSYHGLEIFGVYELATNSEEEGDGKFTQLALDLVYRFGSTEQFYVGGRYNQVSGEITDEEDTQEIQKFALAAGWFITSNMVAKVEYVHQSYEGDGWLGTKFVGAEFRGINLEAGISF